MELVKGTFTKAHFENKLVWYREYYEMKCCMVFNIIDRNIFSIMETLLE